MAGRAFGGCRQPAEEDRHDGARQQHEDGAGDRRGDDAAQEGEPRDQHELKDRGNDDEARQHGGSARHQRADGDRDVGGAVGDAQWIPRPESPDSEGQKDGAESTYRQGAEKDPRQVAFGLAACLNDDGGGGGHPRQPAHNALEALAKGHHGRRLFVWLVEDVVVCLRRGQVRSRVAACGDRFR